MWSSWFFGLHSQKTSLRTGTRWMVHRNCKHPKRGIQDPSRSARSRSVNPPLLSPSLSDSRYSLFLELPTNPKLFSLSLSPFLLEDQFMRWKTLFVQLGEDWIFPSWRWEVFGDFGFEFEEFFIFLSGWRKSTGIRLLLVSFLCLIYVKMFRYLSQLFVSWSVEVGVEFLFCFLAWNMRSSSWISFLIFDFCWNAGMKLKCEILIPYGDSFSLLILILLFFTFWFSDLEVRLKWWNSELWNILIAFALISWYFKNL